MLAGQHAWTATKARAVEHVTSPETVRTPSGPRPDRPGRPYGATERLRAHFATLDPADAIRTAAQAKPGATPAELADELGIYGVHVTAVAVALVLGQQPPSVRLDRTDTSGNHPDTPDLPSGPQPLTGPDARPDASGYRPESIAEAVKHVARQGIKTEAATAEVSRLLGRQVKQETVLRYLRGLPRQDDTGIGRGGGGYA
jgi:hypothetical protein